MPQFHDFKRRVQEDPTQVGKYFRLGDLSWFNKPEGEGCIEKFCSINYHLAKTIIPATAIYQICVKSIRSPLGWLFMTGKVVAPFHVAASIFAVSACGLCKYRGKDDWKNWAGAGALMGAVPGLTLRSWMIKKNFYQSKTPLWFFTIPIGMSYFAVLAGLFGEFFPQLPSALYRLNEERFQYQPERNTFMTETFSMPGERPSLDFLVGGKTKDMPISWVGDTWDYRKIYYKKQYGYLEGELDQVPAIEKYLRES